MGVCLEVLLILSQALSSKIQCLGSSYVARLGRVQPSGDDVFAPLRLLRWHIVCSLADRRGVKWSWLHNIIYRLCSYFKFNSVPLPSAYLYHIFAQKINFF